MLYNRIIKKKREMHKPRTEERTQQTERVWTERLKHCNERALSQSLNIRKAMMDRMVIRKGGTVTSRLEEGYRYDESPG
jgi:hypothetical protein